MALRKRRNQADLSGDERKQFVNAVLQMKTNGTYDWYVRIHMDSMAMVSGGGMNMWAHTRPAFLPWHRQFILDFENDLRAADTQVTGQPSNLTLPYWDWINYRAKKKFLWWGRIWGDNFMGPDGSGPDNKVSSGPFAGWTPTYDPGPGLTTNDPPMQPFLQRTLGKDADSLPTDDHWKAARNIKTYDVSWFDSNVDVPIPTAQDPNPPNPVHFGGLHSFRNVFEGWVPWADSATALPLIPNLHNRVHVWVGGSMGPSSSPNDPVFFLHHCNVDRLWAQWWSDDPTRPYLPADGEPDPTDPHGENVMGMHTGPNEVVNLTGHHLHDPMRPWDGRNDPLKGTMPTITPADVLNHIALGYGYDPDDRVALNASGTP